MVPCPAEYFCGKVGATLFQSDAAQDSHNGRSDMHLA